MSDLEVTTKFNHDLIEQSITGYDRIERMSKQVIKLQDDGVKEALNKLGYLEPIDAEILRAELNAALESASYIDVDGLRVGPCMYRSLKEQLSESLEREQALAAHLKKAQRLADSDRVDDEFYDEDGDLRTGSGWKSKLGRDLNAVLENAPTTALTKRDLIKQAEALESAYEDGDSSTIWSILSVRAEDLRQQAAAL